MRCDEIVISLRRSSHGQMMVFGQRHPLAAASSMVEMRLTYGFAALPLWSITHDGSNITVSSSFAAAYVIENLGSPAVADRQLVRMTAADG